jgi:hypothetical protein
METIFTLLLILLPLAFKLIGKKLEKAGQQPGQSEPVEDWAEVLRRHLEIHQQALSLENQTEEGQNAVPEKKVQQKKTSGKKNSAHVKKPVAPVAKASMPILNEPKERKKEKIDVKKLIIYSEIMKPKYNE